MATETARHPSDQALRAHGLGQLGDSSAELVSAHLENCPDCRARVAEVSSDSFLGRLRDAGGPAPTSGPFVSSTDGSPMPDGAVTMSAGTLPPGLAGHPDYEILRELGRGGMGVVYLARNKLMGRSEVLKVLSGRPASHPGMLDRSLVEIRSAAMLHHPNIVTAYSALRLGDDLVLAMEHVEGLDLARVVGAKGPLPVIYACHYVHQVALGLQHAHENGLVHRDIKPSNLMLARQGNKPVVKILDFGLAKARREQSPAVAPTQTGQAMGTPAYMAPEQMGDPRRADIRADIYSLGCTLYFLLTGKPPFEGKDVHEVLQAHHSMEAVPLNLARPEVPVSLAVIVATMMAKEPERRFQTPRDVSQALVSFLRKQDSTPRATAPAASGSLTPGGFQLSQGTGWTADPPAAGTPPPNAPRPPVGRAPGPVPSESEWALPIQIEPDEDLSKEVQSLRAAGGTPAWLWPAAAGVLVLLGLAVVLGMSIERRNRSVENPATASAPARRTIAPPSIAEQPKAPPPQADSPPAPPRTALELASDPASPPMMTRFARDADPPDHAPNPPKSLDETRMPRTDPPGEMRPPEPIAAPTKLAGPPEARPEAKAELTLEQHLESRGLRKAGRYFVVETEREFGKVWNNTVKPAIHWMEAAYSAWNGAIEVENLFITLSDRRDELLGTIENLRLQMNGANRERQLYLQNLIRQAEFDLNQVRVRISEVQRRRVTAAQMQKLAETFHRQRDAFIAAKDELDPVYVRMLSEYNKLDQDEDVKIGSVCSGIGSRRLSG